MKDENLVLNKGIFTLSLDTELSWGAVDKPHILIRNKEYYEKTREVIAEILKLLEKYKLSATWAVVGHLFLKECNLVNGQKHPSIQRSVYPWYSDDWFEQSPCTNHKEAPLWYGQDIIKKLLDCRIYQEIACHSFSHIPFGDKNTKRITVQGELEQCICEAKKLDLELKSFVFPRNNVGYIDELIKYQFRAYRGKEPSWYMNFPDKLNKICHMLDQFLAINPPVNLPQRNKEIYNIPASMLYLSMNGLRRFIPLKARIIKATRGIVKAAEQKKIFHMWFHPFNIATNPEKLLCGLDEIFMEVNHHRELGTLEVKTMVEIVNGINNC